LRTRRLVIGVVAMTVVAAAVVGVYAAPREGGDGQGDGAAWLMDRHDANGDGKIERDEFQGPENAFVRMDANGDGVITADEITARRGEGDRPGRRGGEGDRPGGRRNVDPEARWQQALERFDADNDGQISAEEFQGPERAFTLLDQNADGIVTQEEGTRFGRGMGDRPGGGPGGPPDQGRNFERMLQNLDEDGDGSISREEWPGRDEMFDRLDADGDGFVTEEDLQQAQQQRRERPDPAQLFIRMLDKNGDGQVSNDEWTGFFTVADENEDDLLSHAELIKQLQQMLRPAPELAPAQDN